MNHFNLKPIQNFDIEDRHAIVAYIEERPLEEFTVANIQSTLLTARNMSEAAIGISGLSGVAGIVASGMAFSFAGFTLPVLMPIAGAVASGLWAIKAFTDTNAQSAEYNLLRDPKIQQKLGMYWEAMNMGIDRSIVAQRAYADIVNALGTGRLLEVSAIESAPELQYLEAASESLEYEPQEVYPVATQSQGPTKEQILDYFAMDMFESRSIEGFSQTGKTSFVTEFALLAQSHGMDVWVLNLGYSDVSPLVDVASRSVLCHWKYNEDADRDARKAKLTAARQLLKDFSKQSFSLLVVDEVAVLHHYPELLEVLEELQNAINEQAIDGKKRNSGILMSGTPVTVKKGSKGTNLTGFESISLVDTKGMNASSHPEGSNTSSLGRRFLVMGEESICIDCVAVHRPIFLSNVFDPTIQTISVAPIAQEHDSFSLGFGSTAATISEISMTQNTSVSVGW